ncbi:MAG: PhoU domain-containing protein [Actinobacteria bacterium]|nr:PhoU domain-containing protein [Actinomycetota bacterium]
MDEDGLDRQMIQLFAMVGEGLAGATHALLAGEREMAIELAERDQLVDSLYREIDESVLARLATHHGDPRELRTTAIPESSGAWWRCCECCPSSNAAAISPSTLPGVPLGAWAAR